MPALDFKYSIVKVRLSNAIITQKERLLNEMNMKKAYLIQVCFTKDPLEKEKK